MKKYELTCLISPNIEKQEIISLSEKINAIIKENGGVLDINQNTPIKKNLAYSIKKQTSAYIYTLNFSSEPEKLELFKKSLEAESNILRFMLIKKEIGKEKPIKRRLTRKILQAPVVEKKEKSEEKVELEKLDKKLEEILGDV